MTERKLIIPAEIKLCATCSYWDGERKIDDDINVVIVAESCEGECLCGGETKSALTDVRNLDGCIWEDVSDAEGKASPDKAASSEAGDKPR